MKRILYEGEFREISEIDVDHIHLDDGTVIRNNEIIKFPLFWVSKYSRKRQFKSLNKDYKKLIKDIESILDNILNTGNNHK